MRIGDLERAIRESWDKETCYPGCADEWSLENPSLGQCAVTALVVQDHLGGELLYCKPNHHYWNRTPGHGAVDFTRGQFPPGTVICLDEIRTRSYILDSEPARKADTPRRYRLLKRRVEERLRLP